MLQITEKIKDQTYEISLVSTGIIVGEFIKVDGFYYFSESKNRMWGMWSQEFLESLTTELRSMNKELNDSIDEYFNFQ
jgi:hypothetical protein